MLGIVINGEMQWDHFETRVTQLNACKDLILVDGGANHFNEMLVEAEIRNLVIQANPILIVGDLDSIGKSTIPALQARYPHIDVVKFNRDKDFTDLEGALRLATEITFSDIRIFHALGGRIDQTLGNLLYLFRSQYAAKVSIWDNDKSICVHPAGQCSNPLLCRHVPIYVDKDGLVLCLQGATRDKPGSYPERANYQYSFHGQGIINDLELINHCMHHPGDFNIQTPNESVYAVSPDKPFTSKLVKGQVVSLIPLWGPVEGITTHGLKWELLNGTLDKNFTGMSNAAVEEHITVSISSGTLLCITNNLLQTILLS